MAKAKNTDKTEDKDKDAGAPDTTGVVTGDGNIVHIPRGPWNIDKTQVKEIQELSPTEVMVIMNVGASYRLTREEAAPLL